MEYYSTIKKNTFVSVLIRWMKLEPIIHSEVSQKEKHQYSILTTSFLVFLNSSAGIPSPSLAMLPKAHLISHCRMSGSRWVITSLCLFKSLKPFLYSSSVYSCHLFCFGYVHTISVLYYAHLCIKYYLGISNFPEEIPSPSHSIVSLYFFALFT